jgi:hypothetical protein
MTLPFGTRVTSCPNGKTTLHGVIVGCGSTGLDGIESYVVAWKHQALAARPTWHFSTELTVVPDDKPDVRALANEAGLMCPDDRDGTDLMRWLFECLRGAYDHLESIDRLLPFQPGREYTERVQGLLNDVAAARQEVNVARARAEETRRELEARTLRVVTTLNPNGQDVVWGRVLEDGSIAGVPRPHRRVPRDRDDVAVAYIIGPDPNTLLEGL